MPRIALDAWHRIVATRDAQALDALLAEDVVFHSPVVHSPQRGRALARAYLGAAIAVLGAASFRYVREIVGAREAALEFEVELDGLTINGIDLIRWDETDRIVDFKVMVRPAKALALVQQKMAEALQAAAGGPR